MLAAGVLLQDRYQIVGSVGQGGMGTVYEAVDGRLGHTVAIKQICHSDPSLRAAFEREARLLAALRHPALPRVTDHFVEASGHFLVMEFIPGSDLATRLREQTEPLAVDDVLRWADQLLDALSYLHSQQPPVIHRDIKPHNLKLNARGEVMLLDFGLAKGAPGQSPAERSVAGYTLHYASPEQLRGEPTTPPSDLYALGATLYALLSTVKPPDALQRLTVLAAGESDPLRPLQGLNPAVPAALAIVIHQALALSPRTRFADAPTMRFALHAIGGETTTIVASAEPVQPTLPANNLPPQLTSFVGREAEVALVQQLLQSNTARLVTLTGPGGIGKTRLALAIAVRTLAHFADGVYFVSLAAICEPELVLPTIAQTLGLRETVNTTALQSLQTYLQGKVMLLVLDNFEHLLRDDDTDAVGWVRQILQRAPGVQVLITSRERLRLSGERVFELSGLALSERAHVEESDAVLLFLERAQHVASQFTLDATNRAAITRICALVEGMPLCIELAATWAHVLSCAEIADEIARNLDFLALADRDMAPRHRSMRAVFDHSWALLNDEEQVILGRLATFRGGWNREAAQAVAGANLPLLAGLIDKSLVRRRLSDSQARYELHEVVRQYAGDKRRAAMRRPDNDGQPSSGLEQDEVWLAHYTYFYKLVAAARTQLYGREQLHWLQVLDTEHANLRAALDRCLSTQDFVRGLQLALQLEEYWYIRGHHREGLQRLLDFLHQDLSLLPEKDVAHGFVAATLLAIAVGNYTAAHGYITRSIDPIRRLGDQTALAKGLRYWGLIALNQGDYAAAEALASEALQAAQTVNNRYEAATTLGHLAEISLIRQDYTRAQALGEQAVQILRLIEDKNQLAGSLRRLAQTRIHQQQWDAARQDALESLALNNEIGDQRGTAASLVLLTSLLAATEQWSAVAQVLGAANHLLAQAHASLLPADQLVYDEMLQRVTAQFPDFPTLYEVGRTLMAQERTRPYNLAWLHIAR